MNRSEQILEAAMRIAAKRGGWAALTRSAVAQKANCSDALINRYFGSMDGLRYRMIRLASHQSDYKVIGQAIASGDKHACKLPRSIRAKALATLGA